MGRFIVFCMLVLASGFTSAVAQRTPSTAASSSPGERPIDMRIVAADSGEPLPYARVALLDGHNDVPSTARADADGHLTVWVGSPVAHVRITKSGFVVTEIPIASREGTVERTSSGRESVAHNVVRIALVRAAVIEGTVLDAGDEPAVHLSVMVDAASGADRWDVRGETSTDDRGMYRVAGLAPGRYRVRVEDPSLDLTDRPFTESPPVDVTAALISHVDVRLSFDPAASGMPGIVSGGLTAFARDGTTRPSRSGQLHGDVMTADRQPLGGAIVRAFPETEVGGVSRLRLDSERTARANGGGVFVISDLAPGRYSLLVSKAGYVMRDAHVRVDDATSAAAARGIVSVPPDRDVRVDVVMNRFGTLSGRVVDEVGEPVEKARIQLFEVRYERGRRRLVETFGGTGGTDDEGRYRLSSLPPGRYLLAASIGQVGTAERSGYIPTFFPGVDTTSAAIPLAVEFGNDQSGFDLALLRGTGARITGTIVDAAGVPTGGGRVELVPRMGGLPVPVGARITNGHDFDFRSVPPGAYVIRVDQGRRSGSTEGPFAAVPVIVGNADITGLRVSLTAGTRVTGSVRVDRYGAGVAPSLDAVRVSLVPVDDDLGPNVVAASGVSRTGQFALNGISGSRRVHVAGVPEGWMVATISRGGVDVANRAISFEGSAGPNGPIDVLLTDRVTRFTGLVVDARTTRRPGATVIAFSTSSTDWYPFSRFVRRTTARADARFTIEGLPAGSYYVAAVAAPPGGDEAWQDPVFLESLRADAMVVTAGPGEAHEFTLRMAE